MRLKKRGNIMKKLILTALMALCSINLSAELYFRPLTEIESTVVNTKKTYFDQNDYLNITLIFDNDKITFNAYEKTEDNEGTIYLYGRGNNNINVIYIKDNKLIIPTIQHRAIVVDDEKLLDKIYSNLNYL